jgi:hypothetical protein
MPNSIMTVVMLAIFAAMVAVAGGYPAEARFMTYVVGIPALGLCVLQLLLDLRERRRPAPVADERSALEEAEARASRLLGHEVRLDVTREPAAPMTADGDGAGTLRRELIVWGYFLGLIAAILLFGFRLAVPLFLVAFLRFFAKASWRMTLALSAAAAVAMLVAFERALGIQLHSGFATDWILERLF